MERLTNYNNDCKREMICRYEDCDTCEEYCPDLTMECYKDLLKDFRDGTFARHLYEAAPESSSHFGIMVAVPFLSELTEEFENPTRIDCENLQWKLAVIQKCVSGLRKRPMTELLFCMLRSGH